MNEKILKKYEQAPKTWGVKLVIAFILAVMIAWSSSTVSFHVEEGSSGI
ncbi:MAG TPA: phosphonate ABC transporter, permease protein PhnE, partial [Lachnospiraceae bacterium]|nr:phosphonate ABC transporter, permease protein PhnE [Lachnospiraceae bacterium]